MKYGLKQTDIDKMVSVFKNSPNIQKVILYGSRAKGNYKSYSDIDITLIGTNLKSDELGKIYFSLDNLMLPYKIDISLFKNIQNEKLIEHINRVGKILYTKEDGLR